MIPLVCSWEYFPERKGLITGIVVGAYGFSSFIFTFISTKLVNPNDENPTIVVTNGKETIDYFTADIADNVIIYIYFILSLDSNYDKNTNSNMGSSYNPVNIFDIKETY